ncbi:uncharacterized protein [Montipora capricornis]|uniref:uncharacterized protein n=1 Tax=Montipora capricornis TaxID=246305 RepID=UPI0035F1339A
MRQKNDQPFAELLNRFRTASQTEEDIKCIQSRSIDLSDVNYPSDALHIWAENNPVNRHNEMKLHQIPAQLFHLKATDQYPVNVSQQAINRILARPRSETGGLDANISIKETARVMLTNNIDISDRLINGQLGTVVRIEVNQNNKKPTIIYIKFDDAKAGNSLIQKSTNSFVRQNRVVPIEPVLAKIKIHPNKPSSPEIQRMQFPLTLAYAVSIHKVQGLSLNSLVISFELVKQRSFNYGQVYVALSRATTLNGIHILGKINSKHVKADPRVHEEYKRLREMSKSKGTNEKYKDNATLTICLLNIRSLKKHSVDIKYDANIKNSDLIALTETQLVPHSNDTDIKSHLLPFTLYRQDHPTDRFLSLALCTRRSIETKEHEYFPQANAMKFVIIMNRSTTMCPKFTVLFLYRKNNSNIIEYVSHLRNILGTYPFDIILGDFNINYLNDDSIRPLKSLMTSLGYSQFVQNATFVSSGNILDQIYLKSTKFDIIENTEARRQYTVHQEAERLKAKIQQLDNAKNPSTAGYLLRKNHTLKPHDNTVIKINLNRIEEAEKSLQQIEEKVKIDLELAVLSNGKIKIGRRTSHRFNEDVISVLIVLKTKLVTTKSKLTEFGAKASNIFQRTSAVLQKIDPGLDKDSLCEKGDIHKEIVLNLKQREEKWAELLVSQNVTSQLRSDAKDYLAGLLGKERGEATNSSLVDDKNKDDEDDDDVAWSEEQDESDDDVCSVSVLHKPGEASSSDIEDYGPYWNNSSASTAFLDHLSD